MEKLLVRKLNKSSHENLVAGYISASKHPKTRNPSYSPLIIMHNGVWLWLQIGGLHVRCASKDVWCECECVCIQIFGKMIHNFALLNVNVTLNEFPLNYSLVFHSISIFMHHLSHTEAYAYKMRQTQKNKIK